MMRSWTWKPESAPPSPALPSPDRQVSAGRRPGRQSRREQGEPSRLSARLCAWFHPPLLRRRRDSPHTDPVTTPSGEDLLLPILQMSDTSLGQPHARVRPCEQIPATLSRHSAFPSRLPHRASKCRLAMVTSLSWQVQGPITVVGSWPCFSLQRPSHGGSVLALGRLASAAAPSLSRLTLPGAPTHGDSTATLVST